MGMFSYICDATGNEVMEGDGVHLYLLQNGVIMEYMYGHYDGYGAAKGFEWKCGHNVKTDLDLSQDESNGVAAFLDGEEHEEPTVKSEPAPEQGWRKGPKYPLLGTPNHVCYHEANAPVDWFDTPEGKAWTERADEIHNYASHFVDHIGKI